MEESIKIVNNDIYQKRGDTASIIIGITRNGVAYTPVEGDVIRFSVRETPQSDTYLIEPKVIASSNLKLSSDDTKDLPCGDFWYDIECAFLDGVTQTYGPYRYHLLPDITR